MKIETLLKRQEISVVLSNVLRNEGIDTVEKLSKMSMKEVVSLFRNFTMTHRYGHHLIDEMPTLMKYIK